MGGREFGHLHPGDDQSLHAMLPEELVQAAIAAGWAEPHPIARAGGLPRTAVMLYAPRDRAELEVVCGLVLASYRFAGGRNAASPTSGGAQDRPPGCPQPTQPAGTSARHTSSSSPPGL